MMKRRWMDAVFSPRGVAVVGSSSDPSKLAFGTLQAVLQGRNSKQRQVVAIDPHNRHHEKQSYKIDQTPRYTSPHAVPLDLACTMELAVLVTKSDSCLSVMRDCIASFPSLKAVNIVAGGFREHSDKAVDLELKMVQEAHAAGLRLIGPNSVGSIDTYNDFSSMFLRTMPNRGGLSLVSQSGGICGAAVELLINNKLNLGFSKLLSLGNAADVGFCNALEVMADDANTKIIMLYMEELAHADNGEQFVELAREISREKPIVALKAGSTAAGSRAIQSHTGSLAGHDEIFKAAMRAAGIVQANSLSCMMDMAYALSCHQNLALEKNPFKVALVTNAGGPAATTVDTLVKQAGVSFPAFSTSVQDSVKKGKEIHPLSSTSNPIDLLGGGTPLAYRSAVEVVADHVDAIVCLHVPTNASKPAQFANELVSAKNATKKPVISMLPSNDLDFVDPALSISSNSSIPTFVHAEGVVRAFQAWEARQEFRIKQGEDPVAALSESRIIQAHQYLSNLKVPPDGWIREHEARIFLESFGFSQPKAESVLGDDGVLKEKVLEAAENVGYPVVLKRVRDVHKSRTGGVALDLRNSADVEAALEKMVTNDGAPILVCEFVSADSVQELIIGFTRDAKFGPAVCFGTGGIYAEALGDVAFGLPPQTRQDTLNLIEKASLPLAPKAWPVFDVSVVANVVECCAAIARAFPDIAEMDMNPVIVGISPDTGKTTAIVADVKFRLDKKAVK